MHPVLRQVADQSRAVWSHPSNRGARVRAVGRAVRYQVRARVLGRSSVARVGVRGRVVVRLHDWGSSQALYANPVDHAEMTFWRGFLRPGDLFLDVGANVGIYSLWAADRDAEVWAFEPDDEARGRLEENAALSGLAVAVHPCAVGAGSGTMRITEGLGTSNRMSADDAPGTREVPVRSLDDLVGDREVRGIKVDVEGVERLVVEGAARLLDGARVDVLQLEWNHMSDVVLGEGRRPLWDLLRAHGYVGCRPENGRLVNLARDECPGHGADLFFASPRCAEGLDRLE
ncbi:FkbM family methyltransferase [Marmoricola endophyticus]|nr:FkbM family methyltransferase [Marmoricola endophyticus]